jgi:hypothetical protein
VVTKPLGLLDRGAWLIAGGGLVRISGLDRITPATCLAANGIARVDHRPF